MSDDQRLAQPVPHFSQFHGGVCKCESCQALGVKPELPRRAYLDKMVPAELWLFNAQQSVEELGAHPMLTEAQQLLSKARDLIGDYVDGKRS